jgi:hypothetical protein
MTPRQQRRLEQKLARKAEKKQRACTSTLVEACVAAPEPTTAPVSERKVLANRANAQLSSGAVTAEGKQIISQNATKHGLTGRFQVLPDESQADFDELLAGYIRAQAPADQDEVELVKQMAQSTWLSNRSIRLQDQCLIAIQSGTPKEQKQARQDLTLYMRYMTTHDRAFTRHSTELRKRQNQRQKAARGFVSQKLREAAESRRDANEIRKREIFELRQVMANCRRERLEIQNRIAAAKAERLEPQNMAESTAQTEGKMLAAAA